MAKLFHCFKPFTASCLLGPFRVVVGQERQDIKTEKQIKIWFFSEVLMFETEDLVLRKNEKNFVLCLLEVARRSSRFGMSAPTLIQMEEEIEEEIREDMNLPPEETPLPKPQRRPSNFKNLDQMVNQARMIGWLVEVPCCVRKYCCACL